MTSIAKPRAEWEIHKQAKKAYHDLTKRQISEAIQIQHAQGAVMNRQDEWRQVKLPHIQLSLA